MACRSRPERLAAERSSIGAIGRKDETRTGAEMPQGAPVRPRRSRLLRRLEIRPEQYQPRPDPGDHRPNRRISSLILARDRKRFNAMIPKKSTRPSPAPKINRSRACRECQLMKENDFLVGESLLDLGHDNLGRGLPLIPCLESGDYPLVSAGIGGMGVAVVGEPWRSKVFHLANQLQEGFPSR